MLSALTTVPGAALLTTPKVRLFKGATPVSSDSLIGSFTATAFTGYADQALTLSGPVNYGGSQQAMVGTVNFVMAGTVTPVADVADGYVLTNGTTAFYGGERFSATVAFNQLGDFVTVNVVLPEDLSTTTP
jgi:hypothetical protein